MESLPSLANNSSLNKLPVIISTQCYRESTFPHIHSHVQLIYVLSGTLKHTLNGHSFVQNSGSCAIILPYTQHQTDLTESDDTPVVIFISFNADFMIDRGYRFFPYGEESARFEEKMLPSFCELSGERKETATQLIRDMMNEFSKQKSMSYDRIASLLADFFRILCVDIAKDCDITLLSERISGITRSVKYIEEHYAEKITIDTLCSVAAMSRCMFTRHFKAITGATFAHFLLAFRLERVKNLLSHTELSLNEIAKMTGLNDKVHLSHMFTRNIGMSPITYRRQAKPVAAASSDATIRRWAWLEEK